ncbi:MAG: ATP-binding cassette domain-containing protein [Ignavibacteriaceae bacterium]
MKNIYTDINYIYSLMKDELLHYKKIIILSSSLLLFSVLISYLMPRLSVYVIDIIIPSKKIILLIIIMLFIVFLYIIKTLIDFYVDLNFLKVKEFLGNQLKNKIMGHYSKITYEEFEKIHGDDKYSLLIVDVTNIKKILDKSVVYFIKDILSIILGFTLLINIFPLLTFLTILIMIVFALINLKIINRIKNQEENLSKEFGSMLNTFFEPINKFLHVKLQILFPFLFSKYLKKQESYYYNYIYLSKQKNKIYSGQYLLNQFLSVFVFIYAGVYIILNKATIGQLVGFNLLLSIVLASFTEIMTANIDMQSALASIERIKKFFNKEVEEHNSTPCIKTDKFESLVFDKVSFKYPLSKDNFFLSKINLDIKASEIVTIIGKNGSGKSTLFKLIMGLYMNFEGSIKFNNFELNKYNLGHIRKIIGFIPQDIFFISGSLKENITLDNKEDITLLKEVADACGLSNYFENLNDNIETLVESEKNFLSGGFQQRVAFARALYKKPGLLLIDEGTSQLDPQIDKFLRDILLKLTSGGIAVIIITHRITTLETADRVLLLNNGCLTEILNPETLNNSKLIDKVYN